MHVGNDVRIGESDVQLRSGKREKKAKEMRGIYLNAFRAVGAAALAGLLSAAATSEAAVKRICPASGGGPNPAIANLNQGPTDCWTGPNWNQGTTWARGEVVSTHTFSRSVRTYAFWGLEHGPYPDGAMYNGYAQSVGYNSSNVITCYAFDYTGNGAWEANSTSACNNTSYVKVEAWASIIS